MIAPRHHAAPEVNTSGVRCREYPLDAETASQADLSEDAVAEAGHMSDISFTPIAMPMLALTKTS